MESATDLVRTLEVTGEVESEVTEVTEWRGLRRRSANSCSKSRKRDSFEIGS